MPFTPSHIAAVVPLIASSDRVRRYLDPWALAMGAMVPDLPIFLPFLPDYTDWHSWLGLVTIDPLAVLILLPLFHLVLRDPLIALLPPSLAARAHRLTPSAGPGRPASVASAPAVTQLRAPDRLRFLPMVLGAVVGSATHLLWDSFTHSAGVVNWGSWLYVSIFGAIPLFRLLQYVSSAIGLVVVVWWAWRGLSRMPAVPVPDRLRISPRTRLTVLVCAALGIVGGALLWPLVDEPNPAFGLAAVLTKTGAGTVIGLCLVLACYAVVWQVTRRMAVSEGA